MSSHRISVLDCGPGRVTRGDFSEGVEGLHLDRVANQAIAATSDDTWLAATAAAAGSLLENGTGPRDVVLVLPASCFLWKHVRVPRAAAMRDTRVVDFEVRRFLPTCQVDRVWASLAAGDRGDEVDFLVVAAKRELVATLCHAAIASGRKVTAVVPSVLAAWRLAQAEPASPRWLLVEAGTRDVTFLQSDGTRLAVRAIALVAEESSQTGDPREPGDEGSVARVAQEAMRTILHFQRVNDFAEPERIVLTGDILAQPAAASLLAGRMKSTVVRLTPRVAAPGGVNDSPALANLAGGAVVGLARVPFLPALLPVEVIQRQQSRRRRPWLIAAAVLAMIALLPPIASLQWRSAALRREIAQAEAALTPLREGLHRTQAQRRARAKVKNDIAWLRDQAARKTAWLGLLGALQDRLAAVEDVWLDGLQTTAPAKDAPAQMIVTGWMIDRSDDSHAGRTAAERMKMLIRELRTIPAITDVTGVQLEPSRPHLSKFRLVLSISPSRLL